MKWKVIGLLALWPIKALFAWVFWCWWPSWKFWRRDFKGKDHSDDVYYSAMSELIPEVYDQGDGAKFIGILHATTGKHWELVKKYWGPGYFKRYMDDREGERFSGDMISGMLLAIVMQHIRVGLTHAELLDLREIWDSTIKDAPVMTFKGPGDWSRGKLLGFASFGNDVLKARAFLDIGNWLFDGRYARERSLLKWLYPYLLWQDVACAFGKVYGASWSDEHSHMICYFAATKAGFDYSKPMNKLARRYKWNPDIQAMWSELGNSPYSMIHWYWLNDMSLESRSDKCPWEETFFSLRSFQRKNMARIYLSPRWLGGLWPSEQNPHIPQAKIKGATANTLFLFKLERGF